MAYSSSWKTYLRATKHHLPYEITQQRWKCPTTLWTCTAVFILDRQAHF